MFFFVIMNILKTLHSEGRTVIIITHDNDIAANANRIVHIEDGKITSDSSNNGNVNRDDIAREIRNGSGSREYDSNYDDEYKEDEEEPYDANEIELTDASAENDFDLKPEEDNNIDLHLNGDN